MEGEARGMLHAQQEAHQRPQGSQHPEGGARGPQEAQIDIRENDLENVYATPRGHDRIETGATIPEGILEPESQRVLFGISEVFRRIGVVDWAVGGSLAKRINGAQADASNDIDIFTTEFGFNALKVYLSTPSHRKGLEDIGFTIAIIDSITTFGPSSRIHILNEDLGIDVEVFGEREGGTLRLGDENQEATLETYKAPALKEDERVKIPSFDISVLSKESLLRHYTYIFGKELVDVIAYFKQLNQTPAREWKMDSRFVTFLQLTRDSGTNPFTTIRMEWQTLHESRGHEDIIPDAMWRDLNALLQTLEKRYDEDMQQEPETYLPKFATQLPETIVAVSSLAKHPDQLAALVSDESHAAALFDRLSHAPFHILGLSPSTDGELRGFYKGLFALTEAVARTGSEQVKVEFAKTLEHMYERTYQPQNGYVLLLEELSRVANQKEGTHV